MKNKTVLFGIALVFLTCLNLVPRLAEADSGVFIGNNGDGAIVNDNIYLYDLYLNSTHLEPYFGKEIFGYVSLYGWQLDQLTSLGVDKKLLLRKITDLEKINFGWGVFVLNVINAYSWSFSGTDLPLLPDEAPVIDVRRVPLARRVQFDVFFDKKNFQRLNAEHKVALVIHEAISSLIKPVCVNGLCTQSAFAARSLTGVAFEKKYSTCVDRMGDCLGSAKESLLNIDWDAADYLYYGMELNRESGKGSPGTALVELGPQRINEQSFWMFSGMANDICSAIGSQGDYSLYLVRQSFVLVPFNYSVRNGGAVIETEQYGFEVKYRSGVCSQKIKLDSKSSCNLFVSKMMIKWYDLSSFASYADDRCIE